MPSSGGRIISSGANLGPSVSAGPMSYHGQWKAECDVQCGTPLYTFALKLNIARGDEGFGVASLA